MTRSPATPDRSVHPLDGWMRSITAGDDHAGFNATLLPTKHANRVLLIWRSGFAHMARPGSELRMLASQDECASLSGARSIYASPEWDTRNFAGGPMGNGRVGLVAARFRGQGATLEFTTSIFLSSDDGGTTWTAREIAAPATAPTVSFHGDIIPWPTAAGGDDETGFAVFSYNFARKAIDGLYTRDNGQSWTWRTDLCVTDGVIADHLNECWTAASSPGGPWLMAVRSVTSGRPGPLVLFTSTDLVAWEGPRDGGIPLSGNPPALIVEGGVAYLYTVARRGARRELPNETGEWVHDRLLVARAPFDDLVAGRTDFAAHGGWFELGPLPEGAVGYIFPRKIRERWFAVFNFGETGAVGSSEAKRCWLALMTPHRPVVVDAPTLRAATPHDSLLDNGDFAIRNLGTGFGAVPSGAMLADRWAARHPPGDAVTAERVEWLHPLGGLRNGLRKSCPAPSGPHATAQTIGPADLGAGARITVALRARATGGGWIAGLRLVQKFGRNGPPARSIPLSGRVELTDEFLLYTFTGALPRVESTIVDPAASLQLVIDERRPEMPEAYDLSYSEISLILSPEAGLVRARSAADTQAACARYRQRLHLRGLVTGAGRRGVALLQAPFPRMARPPVAALRGPDGRPIADAVALALSDGEAAFLVGPRPVGELVEAVLDLDAEWTTALDGSAAWHADPQAPGLASLSAAGITIPLEILHDVVPEATPTTGPDSAISLLGRLVELEAELRSIILDRPADLETRRADVLLRIREAEDSLKRAGVSSAPRPTTTARTDSPAPPDESRGPGDVAAESRLSSG